MMLIFKVFVTLPLQFNDNNGEKTLSGTELFTSRCVSQVCFHTLHAMCLLCITARLPPLRWTKYGLLNLTQRFDQSMRFLSTCSLGMNMREVI